MISEECRELIATKYCPGCKERKPATTDYFGAVRTRHDGLAVYCRPCGKEKDRLYKRKDRAANPGKNAKACRRYAQMHPEKKRALYQEWYARNGDIARAYSRAKIANDPKAHRDRVSKWREQNPTAFKETALRSYAKRRLRPEVRINDSVRASIRKSLQRCGVRKVGRTVDLLGYSAAKLKAHLERQFTKQMGWHNYGEWHIDHILPLCQFKFASVDDLEFKAAWALTNLRPLWGPDNQSKSGKRMTLL